MNWIKQDYFIETDVIDIVASDFTLMQEGKRVCKFRLKKLKQTTIFNTKSEVYRSHFPYESFGKILRII